MCGAAAGGYRAREIPVSDAAGRHARKYDPPFCGKANTAGPVTVTDVTVVEAPPEKITNSTRSLADYIAQATQQVSLFGPGDSVGVGSVNGKPIDGDLVMGDTWAAEHGCVFGSEQDL